MKNVSRISIQKILLHIYEMNLQHVHIIQCESVPKYINNNKNITKRKTQKQNPKPDTPTSIPILV